MERALRFDNLSKEITPNEWFVYRVCSQVTEFFDSALRVRDFSALRALPTKTLLGHRGLSPLSHYPHPL